MLLAQDLVEENQDEEVDLVSEEAFAVDFIRNKLKNYAKRLENLEGLIGSEYDLRWSWKGSSRKE